VLLTLTLVSTGGTHIFDSQHSINKHSQQLYYQLGINFTTYIYVAYRKYKCTR